MLIQDYNSFKRVFNNAEKVDFQGQWQVGAHNFIGLAADVNGSTPLNLEVGQVRATQSAFPQRGVYCRAIVIGTPVGDVVVYETAEATGDIRWHAYLPDAIRKIVYSPESVELEFWLGNAGFGNIGERLADSGLIAK